MTGTVLENRYEIEEIVGSGGMAIVYKATDRLLNRHVAIKMLREELKDDKEFVERFRIEAQSAASLNHSNIVSVHDVGEENGIDYFVMEYIDGLTLKERIQSGPIGWKQACGYAMQICDAIEHAHRKNIVHRDIKPHNMMITKDNAIKVTDFGIARAVTSSTIVRQGNVIGSVHYFSPEQACGGVVDFKSDIYSIGVVLYEMLTGKVPFDAENAVAIAKMQVDAEPVSPSTVNPAIPEQVGEIVLKAMAKQPNKRYASAAEFADDLKKAIVSPESVSVKDNDATRFIPVVKKDDTRKIPAVPKEPENKIPERKTSEKKNYAMAWIVSAAIVVLGILMVAFFLTPEGSDEEIPSLVGMQYEEAAEKYADAKFHITIDEETHSSEDAGTIIAQEPTTGKVKDISEIKVTISKGKGNIILDNYVGKDIEEAKSALAEKDLAISVEYNSHATYPKDTVYKQSPGHGSTVRKEDKITLYVSTGNEDIKVEVPVLKGYTKSVAQATLEAVGLELGEIKEEHSSKKEGEIIEQSIVAGTEVKAGTKISITVSIGPDSTPTPKPSATPSAKPSAKPTEEVTETSVTTGED